MLISVLLCVVNGLNSVVTLGRSPHSVRSVLILRDR